MLDGRETNNLLSRRCVKKEHREIANIGHRGVNSNLSRDIFTLSKCKESFVCVLDRRVGDEDH